jgi:uncharacterized protein (TIGR03067 family)
MMNFARFVLGSVIVVMHANSVVQGQDAAKELQGVWTCAHATIDGNPLAEDTAKQLKLTLTADRYKSQRGDQVLFDSSYKVDASKSPKQIEMIGTEGDLKGKAALGIYKLDGDTLTMCYCLPGKERPTAFESSSGSGAFLVVWKRAEPK